MRTFYTIKKADVGLLHVTTPDGNIYISGCMGRVQEGDVGKHLWYEKNPRLRMASPAAVENDEQFKKRTGQA